MLRTIQSGVEGQGGIEWPNRSRIAVVMTCLLESWSDGKGPPFSVQTTALRPGVQDRAAMTWGTYGVKAGVWRLLKILDAHGVPATFCANARALELGPQAARQIVRSGHEVAAHGYLQDQLLAYMSPQEERSAIARTAEIVNAVTGQAPTGWLSPVLATTEHTQGFLAEAGFLWSGDYNHTDLPYCVPHGERRLVALPHSDFADHRVLRGSPRDWYDVYQDTFDYLYRNEAASYLNITVHSHFGGRPLIAAQIDRLLKYISGFPDVWFVRHDELARFILEQDIREWSNATRFYPAAD